MNKRLYKGKNKTICGVCSGVAEYFNIDPTIVRLGFVFFFFAWGTGLLAYFIAAVIMPDAPAGE